MFVGHWGTRGGDSIIVILGSGEGGPCPILVGWDSDVVVSVAGRLIGSQYPPAFVNRRVGEEFSLISRPF